MLNGLIWFWRIHLCTTQLYGLLTFALSLVHDLQVRVTHAASHQQSTLVPIGLAITAADRVLLGEMGAVWRTHTLRPSGLHLTNLPRTTLHSLTGLCKGMKEQLSDWESTACSVSSLLLYSQLSRHQVIYRHLLTKQAWIVGFFHTITQFSRRTIFTIITSLYWRSHTGVSRQGGMWGWSVFITARSICTAAPRQG